MTSPGKIDLLRQLHAPSARPVIFPNVWDAASARIVEAAGFPAIATGSAGMAFALGYPDGQQLPPREMFDAVARITRIVKVPVTADAEAGYGDIAATVRALLNVGAAGMNLEDLEGETLVPLDEQRKRIETAVQLGIFVNARTDIYLAHIGPSETRLDRTIERLRAFAASGAGSLFVPGVTDENTIQALVNAVDAPLNVLATTGSPSIARLKELGVARVSVGSGPMRATLALLRRIALKMRDDVRDLGAYDSFTRDTIPYDEANQLFSW